MASVLFNPNGLEKLPSVGPGCCLGSSPLKMCIIHIIVVLKCGICFPSSPAHDGQKQGGRAAQAAVWFHRLCMRLRVQGDKAICLFFWVRITFFTIHHIRFCGHSSAAPAGVQPFPRGDHAHAGPPVEQPEGVECFKGGPRGKVGRIGGGQEGQGGEGSGNQTRYASLCFFFFSSNDRLSRLALSYLDSHLFSPSCSKRRPVGVKDLCSLLKTLHRHQDATGFSSSNIYIFILKKRKENLWFFIRMIRSSWSA